MENYRFPLFVNLKGKKAVVIGGGKIGLRRVEVLRRFGAEVTLIAPECSAVPEGVRYLQRPYEKGDLEGAFLATAATNSREINHAVYLEAEEKNILISVADSKEESTFFFPAVCTGSGLVAGVVSQGTEHHKTARAAKEIRRVLEDFT